MAAFSLRSVAPAFVDTPVTLVGGPTPGGAEVLAVDTDGGTIARGEVTWADR